MKVIVCGAGQVGGNIATYLSEEGNDVTVIDTAASLIAELNDTLNVTGIVGHASRPDVLELAGARDADMIIAATQYDEVNMVACQVAHSLFHIPKKIARVREQAYLDPAWENLFGADNMPIDAVISPEVEVARAVAGRLKVPGAFNIIPLADDHARLVSVVCKPDCPLINTPLRHLSPLFPDLTIEIVAIIRGETKIIPKSTDEMRVGDEVYFVTATDHLTRAMASFGYAEPEARRILIVGGGKIGLKLAEEVRKLHPNMAVRLIETNREKAAFAAEYLKDVVVIHGSGLSAEILEEGHISQTEAIITVTNHDETNVLISLLAKKNGCERAITIINNNAYMSLVPALGVDAVVNPRAITVSTILQHIRKGRIKSAHALRDGFAEALEVEALDTSAIVNIPIRELKKPDNVIFGAIIRGSEVFIPRPDSVIRPKDRVIIIAAHAQVKKVEQMFAVRPEYF